MPKTEPEATIGHNGENLTDEQKQKLRAHIAGIRDLKKEAREISSDIGHAYKAAKADGFSTGALRELIKRLEMDADELALREHQIEAYRTALGPLDDTPLGQAAMTREGFAEAAPAH